MSEKKEFDANSAMNDVIADALGSPTVSKGSHALDDKALLAKYGMTDYETVFNMRDGNEVYSEREPCYLLLAENFIGRGRDGSLCFEGAIVVSDDVPNEHRKPLNRAAAIAYCRWLESLPHNRVTIDIGDMSEAAVILSKDPRVAAMSPQQAQFATIKVAEGIKLKREGKNAMDLRAGEINRNFAPQSGNSKAPPLLGIKVSDMSQMTPGGRLPDSAPTPSNVRRAASSALGGLPSGH